MINSFLDISFEVVKKIDNSRYAEGNDKRLVNLSPIVLFSNFKLTTSSRKHLEDISIAHIVSLTYKLTTSTVMVCLLASIVNVEGGNKSWLKTKMWKKHHVRNMLEDGLRFAEYRKKTTSGLENILTLPKNKDDTVLEKVPGITDARKKNDNSHWCVLHYTPSTLQ